MPEQRLTKNQRREAAREAARLTREKQQKRDRLIKWVVPTSISLAIVAIIAIVALVIVNNPPAPQAQTGPRNMASGGILFEAADDGTVVPVLTAAIPEGGEPTPTEFEDDGLAHIVAYVDLTCPACKSFEESYGPTILSLVGSGLATIEYHPIAILDHAYVASSRFSSRANNVAMCVADYAPESFLPVMNQMFALQPSEGTSGHTNGELVDIVRSAGLENADVDQCIQDEYFRPFVEAITATTTNDPALRPGGSFSTPTYVVNGEFWDRAASPDLLEFIQSHITAVPAG